VRFLKLDRSLTLRPNSFWGTVKGAREEPPMDIDLPDVVAEVTAAYRALVD